MPETRSESVGPYGARVRIFERTPGGPIQIEWSGGARRSLTNLTGQPVRDWALALELAENLSRKLRRENGEDLRELMGIPRRRTLRQLLERYHRDVAGSWSDSHRANQEMLQRWWLDRLGGARELHDVTEAVIEREVRRAAEERDWSPRTREKYLMYMRGAFGYARRKLKWIREEQDLTALDFPTADVGGPVYSLDEIRALLEAAPEVDPRVDAALNVAWETISRISAIRQLQVEDLRPEQKVVRFRKEYDKRKKDALVPVSAETMWKLRQLAGARSSGWLFASSRTGQALRYDAMKELLWKVEEAAGVENVKGRAWHAIKRRAATYAERALKDRTAVSRQSRTSEKTLGRVYEQDELGPKLEVVRAQRAALTG